MCWGFLGCDTLKERFSKKEREREREKSYSSWVSSCKHLHIVLKGDFLLSVNLDFSFCSLASRALLTGQFVKKYFTIFSHFAKTFIFWRKAFETRLRNIFRSFLYNFTQGISTEKLVKYSGTIQGHFQDRFSIS